MPKTKTTTKVSKPAVPSTPISGPLLDLVARRGQEGLVVLSAVSGISTKRLNELRLGATPDLMEQVTLESLVSFQ